MSGERIAPALFGEMFDATPSAMVVFDASLRMVHANPAYLAAVGLTLDQLVDRFVFELFPDDPSLDGPSQADDLLNVMRKAIDLGETQTLTEYPYHIPNQSGGFDRKIWNVTEVPILGPDGRTQLVLHTTEDVTEVVDARAELDVLTQRLRSASAHHRTIAETLQTALLSELPVTDELPICGAYRPAADRIGGDWYDAVRSDHGTTVMIGDVVGHDMVAAAAMGQLKSMLRLLALDSTSPAKTLHDLDVALARLGLEAMATVLVAVVRMPTSPSSPGGTRRGFEGGGFEVTVSSAGHPPPLLIRPDGEVELLKVQPDMLIGADAQHERHDTQTILEPGASMLLYTDGLVERRGETIDVGFERLVSTVRRFVRDEVDHWVEKLIDAMVEGKNHDDVALLLIESPSQD